MESKCFIIGAGDLTISELRISEEDFVIAADGGLSYCEFLGVRPNVILGDFDSVGEKEKNFIENLVMQGGEGDETSIPEIVRLKSAGIWLMEIIPKLSLKIESIRCLSSNHTSKL